jgi:hypothetical protein
VLNLLSVCPEAALRSWLYEMHMAARESYPQVSEPGTDPATRLVGVNEMSLVLSSQLRSLGGGSPAYPNEALLDVLLDKARAWSCGDILGASLQRTLDELGDG